jgi:hypothetical protein
MQKTFIFRRLSLSLVVSLFVLLFASTAHAASPWPASLTGTQIASGLATLNTTADGFEASGIEYLSGYGYIINGDDGDVAVVNSAGTVLHYWFPGGDLEDVALTDTSVVDHIIYLANEIGSKIEAFNLDTGAKVANKSWTLSDLPINGGLGMESLAYVPAAYAPASWGIPLSGGFFVAASQAEAMLRVYNININSNGTTVSSIAQIPVTYTDVAALQFSPLTQLLYVVFDSDDKLKEYSLNGTIINSYQLPTTGGSDEGFIMVPDCASGRAQVAISNDAVSSFVTVFNNYPITCPTTAPVVVDADHDGFTSTTDCNDNDASVHANQTYYQDRDNDGLGNPNMTTSACSNVAPAGYVANSNDINDNDHDNDGVSAGVDCNDNDPTISANQIYYADADHDGLGDPNNAISVCSYTVPSGYVTNHNDIKDQPVASLPDVPINLFAKMLSFRSVLLSWGGNGDYYTVRLTDLSTNKTKVFEKITQMSKTLDSKYILAKHSYAFSVRACNTIGCSRYGSSVYFNSYTAKQLQALKLLFRK